MGVEALRGDDPFIMQADGKGWLFAPNGVLDGPLPTHYEPHESPVRNALYAQQGNPARKVYGRRGQPVEPVAAGGARRGVPVRVHRGPADRAPHGRRDEPAAAVPGGAAAGAVRGGVAGAGGERGLAHMDWAHVITSRTAVEARVFVTDRMTAAARRRPCGAPGLDALPLGRCRAGRRRRGERPARGGRRPERVHPGEQGRDV